MNVVPLTFGSVLAFGVLYIIRSFLDLSSSKHEKDLRRGYTGPVKPSSIAIPLIFNGEGYYGDLVIGTSPPGEPDQVLRCYFSTSTQNLWVAGVEGCKPKDCKELKIKPFDHLKSSTYGLVQDSLSHSITKHQELTGRVSKDNIKIGTEEGNSVSIEGQMFGQADFFSDLFQNNEAIYGLSLSFSGLLPNTPEPPIWSLAKRFAVPVFGFYLNSHMSGKFVLGGGDDGMYEGKLQVHNVYRKGQNYMGWFIKVDRIHLDRGGSPVAELVLPQEEALLAQVDSATRHIKGPQWAIDKINSAIFESVGATYTSHPIGTKNPSVFCDQKAFTMFPQVIFSLSGKDYTLRPFEYFMRDKENQMCLSAFEAADTPYFHFGHTFMKKYYTRFDVVKRQIQIALLKK